jgi:hypothetical protein
MRGLYPPNNRPLQAVKFGSELAEMLRSPANSLDRKIEEFMTTKERY